MGADWVALSFVQRREDIKEMRDLVAGRANVMAKLEKPSVIDCLTEDRRVVRPHHGGSR
jgi:pyruvate kinase